MLEHYTHFLTECFYTVELGYNVMKETEYFVSLKTSVVITEEYNVMVNGEELIRTAEYLALTRGVVCTEVVITGLNCTFKSGVTCWKHE
jgi:hypothetical protein